MKQFIKKIIKKALGMRLPENTLSKAFFRKLHAFFFWGTEFLYLIRKIFWVEPVLRSLCSSCGDNLHIERTPYLVGKGSLKLGDNIYISGKIGISFNAKPGLSPELTIGDNSFVGHECAFFTANSIRIGNHCLLATGTRIFDNDGHPLDAMERKNNDPVTANQVAPVTLGDNVWIGTKSIILKGVTIGDRAIIGAGSVVTQDIPADSIAAGNPARVLKKNPPATSYS